MGFSRKRTGRDGKSRYTAYYLASIHRVNRVASGRVDAKGAL